MYEKRHMPLAPKKVFFLRLVCSILIGWMIIACALGIGMAGYHQFESMPWIDAFVNAAMILSGMGPMGTLSTFAGKLFAGFYALFSGLGFIIILGVIFSPIIHRFFHAYHLDDEDEDDDKKHK